MITEKNTCKKNSAVLTEKLLGVTKGILSVSSFQPIPVFVRSVNEKNVLLGISSPLSMLAESTELSVPNGRFTVSGQCVFESAPPIEITGEVTFSPHHNSAVLTPLNYPECIKIIQRREAYRVEAIRNMSFQLDDGTLIHGSILNISTKGFLGVIPESAIDTSKLYSVTIDLDKKNRIKCIAKIVHTCNKKINGKQCLAGFFIKELTPETLKIIREFVMGIQRKKITSLRE